MNADHAQAYRAALAEQTARHATLLEEYRAVPFDRRLGAGQYHGMTDELTACEEFLADSPPLDEKVNVNTGETFWVPKKKGLLGPEHNRLPPPPAKPFSAEFPVLPMSQWATFLSNQDYAGLRPFCDEVYDQDQVGCHDDQTEVLTEEGWQRWPDYDGKAALGTVNQATGLMEFQQPTAIHRYEYDGPLYRKEDTSMSFALTPNHRMWVRRWNERERALSVEYAFCPIDHIGWYSGLMAAPQGFVGTHLEQVKIGNRVYDGNDFVALVALVTSDGWAGSTESTRDRVSFCCFREDRREMIAALAYKLGFVEQSNRRGVWVTRDPALADWFRANIYSGTVLRSPYKRLAPIIRCVSQSQAEQFLRFYGDQHTADGRRSYYTTSRPIADGLQELMLRTGKRAGIYSRPARTATLKDGRTITPSAGVEDITITEWSGNRLAIDRRKQLDTDHYKGIVYCATVPNSILLTRRNGKVLISGNSCASESKDGGMQVCERYAGQKITRFNPWGTYHYVCGGGDNGSTLEDNISSAMSRGCFPEEVWPRSKGWRTTPTAAALEAAAEHKLLAVWKVNSWEEAGSALLYGFAVYYWYDSHAVLMTKLLSTSKFEYRNSWGTSWGDNGFGTMDKSQIGQGFYAIRVSTDREGDDFAARRMEYVRQYAAHDRAWQQFANVG